MTLALVAVTREVALLFLFLLPPGSIGGEKGVAIVEHGVAKHYKVDRYDHNALKEKHLNELQYYGENSKLHKMNLVKELSHRDYYKDVAEKLEMDPDTIVASYKLSEKERVECSSRLFDKIYDKGYKGEFDWNAYIAALGATKGLSRVARELEGMLDCNGISKTEQEAVTRSLFHRMICKKEGSEVIKLNLVEKVAPHWQDLAETFEIDEDTIGFKENIPERAAAVVLKRLYDDGYNGELGWQGVLNVLRDAGVDKVLSKLDKALNSVKVHDEL